MMAGSLSACLSWLSLPRAIGCQNVRILEVDCCQSQSGFRHVTCCNLSAPRWGRRERSQLVGKKRTVVKTGVSKAQLLTSNGDARSLETDESLEETLLSNLSSEDWNRQVLDGGKSGRLRLLIAGGGIGGLVLALAAKKKGIDVKVFERDLSAIRGEGQYRGPIQIQSNALAALEAVDRDAAEEIMANGCVTGDRINGLVDGLTGSWYCKFDTFTPAVERGLPITRVISRMVLQEVLSRAVGTDIIENSATVVDFKDDGSKVTVILEDGRHIDGDLLVGADGIRSKVRTKLFGQKEATYSDYTCYTGIADFLPADIETVGYRVFLGHKQYFVSSDVGHGKMQWYAFYNEPAGGVDPPGGRKLRLMELFGHWCDGVVDLLLATPEDNILRRDIYDRVPILTWSKGRVTLLGDSAHAMQPNLGQGGCMAIEDGFQLALILEKAMVKSAHKESVDIPAVLKRYEVERRIRVGAIHGMARMAAIMASTYKPYLGEGLGPLSASKDLKKWFGDDDALERATTAEWYLIPLGERMPLDGNVTASGKEVVRIGRPQGRPTIIGSVACEELEVEAAVIASPQVAQRHARVECVEGAYFLTDLSSKFGTWISNMDGDRVQAPSSIPVRIHQGDAIEFGPNRKVVFRVKLRKPSLEK